MQTNRFTNAVLVVIAIALVILAGENFSENFRNQQTVVHAAANQQVWEYKFLSVTYAWKDAHVVGVLNWKEDGRNLQVADDGKAPLGEKLQILGSQGWELVTHTPRSWRTNASGEGGATTDEMLIFKRARH